MISGSVSTESLFQEKDIYCSAIHQSNSGGFTRLFKYIVMVDQEILSEFADFIESTDAGALAHTLADMKDRYMQVQAQIGLPVLFLETLPAVNELQRLLERIAAMQTSEAVLGTPHA